MERSILSGQGIQVTTARLVVGNETYPLSGITSVRTQVAPAKRLGWVVLAVVGALLALTRTFLPTAIGLIFLILGAGAAAIAKSRHSVVITTAGVERRAIESTDASFIQAVSVALNDALATR